MKGWMITLTVALCLLIVGSTICTIAFFLGGLSLADLTLDETFFKELDISATHFTKADAITTLYAADTIQTVEISLRAGAIDVESYEGEEYQLTYYDKQSDPRIRVSVKDGKMTVKEAEKYRIPLHLQELPTLVLLVPENALERLDASTDAGKITTTGLTGIADLQLSTAAGEINVQNCRAEAIDLATDAGRIDLADVQAHTLEIDTDAGSIFGKDVHAEKELHADTGAGSVTLSMAHSAKFYTIKASTDIGRCSIDKTYDPTNLGASLIEVDVDTGSIDISFAK